MKLAKHKNSPEVRKRARELRKSDSIIEKRLHNILRVHMRAIGVKFRFQHPIDPYIVDFGCLPAKLIVEIDGMSHDSTYLADARRQRYLEALGYTVRRFSNADVVKDTASVAVTMCDEANALLKLHRG